MPEFLVPERRVLIWLGLAVTLAGLDQLSKCWVLGALAPGQSVALLPFVNFTLVFNSGAAFGLFDQAAGWQRWFFILVAIAACFYILYRFVRRPSPPPPEALAFALILAGALGNLSDRIFYGQVVDFVHLHAGGWSFYIFNVADACISLGVVALLLSPWLARWMPAVGPGAQVTLHFSLELESGEVIDSTRGGAPATLVVGDGNLPPAFEQTMAGMTVGNCARSRIGAEKAFGPVNPDNVQWFRRAQFGPELALEEGLMVNFANQANAEVTGVVVGLDGDAVQVDFNHPLAGREVIFDVEIIAVVPAGTRR